jgi:hypothetical protein
MTNPLLASRRLVALLPALSLALPAAAAPWLPNRSPVNGPLARAPTIAPQVKTLLVDASDRALDRLGKPAAFVTDNRVRIGLIAPFTEPSTPAGIADQAELTNDLKGALNEAAVMVAAEAKPAFHAAIAHMPVDGGTGQEMGATRSLWKTATPELWTALRPLVRREMERNGAYGYLYTLHTIIDFGPDYPALRERLTDSATDQILYGIFVYTAEEEHRLTGVPPSGIGPPGRL